MVTCPSWLCWQPDRRNQARKALLSLRLQLVTAKSAGASCRSRDGSLIAIRSAVLRSWNDTVVRSSAVHSVKRSQLVL